MEEKSITDESSEVGLNKNDGNNFDDGVLNKIGNKMPGIGMKCIYKLLQLYYTAQSPNCPAKVKAAIYAALAYLLLPIDLIPDVLIAIGWTEDVAFIWLSLMEANKYITEDINIQARGKIKDWFGMQALEKLGDGKRA